MRRCRSPVNDRTVIDRPGQVQLNKVSPCQPLVRAVVEVSAAWANVRLAAVEVGEHGVGGGIVIHSFGSWLTASLFWQLACCEPVSEVYSHWVHFCLGDAAVPVQQAYDRAMRSSRVDGN